jgi:DNA mismatch repair protein MSH5
MLAVTPQGRNTLRLMFLRPSLDLGLIEERQRTISVFMRPDNAELVKQTSQVLKRVKNARSAVSNLKRGIDSPSFKQSFDRGV